MKQWGVAIAVQPLVPGFTITGELSSDPTSSMWAAVRTHDDQGLVLMIVPVPDVTQAKAQAGELMTTLDQIANEHVAHPHGGIALADGTFALVLDQVTGGSLAQVVGGRGALTSGQTVTTVAPLFGALAELHAVDIVHGDLQPGSVLFSDDGRPLISDLWVARLLGRRVGSADRTPGFVAPEVVGGAAPSTASDVYAMAALGWFCLTGAPPPSAATRQSLTTSMPETAPRLVEVLTSCLSADPAARPSARAAAVEVFDATPAESVALGPMADPATEITRRIRAAAASVPAPEPRSTSERLRRPLVVGGIALLVAAAVGGGATWFLGRSSLAVQPVAVRSPAQASPAPSTTTPTATPTTPTEGAATRVVPTPTPTPTPQSITDVMTAPDSPRVAAAGLLQALVDARALAYVAHTPALLDLVYAPGATMAGVDRGNISTALKNGAKYLGLAFVVKDVTFLDGTSDTARIRATIVTPAYETGQPDGRKVPHAQEIVPPAVFTLSLTRDGWRILGLTAP